MIIFDTSLEITSYTIYEDFTKSIHESISPVFRRSPFCGKLEKSRGIFNTGWNLSYVDKNRKELFLVLDARSSFKFYIQNKKSDLKDFLAINNDFYESLLSQIKENSFGYYDQLPAPPAFHFNEGFDFLCSHGFYN